MVCWKIYPAGELSAGRSVEGGLRHKRIEGTLLPGDRALGSALVLPVRGQAPRPRSDDRRWLRR